MAHFEQEYLSRLTSRAGGNMSKAARLAGIDRTTLYRLMEKHGMRRDDGEAADPGPRLSAPHGGMGGRGAGGMGAGGGSAPSGGEAVRAGGARGAFATYAD